MPAFLPISPVCDQQLVVLARLREHAKRAQRAAMGPRVAKAALTK